jgi:hypothetical protein
MRGPQRRMIIRKSKMKRGESHRDWKSLLKRR